MHADVLLTHAVRALFVPAMASAPKLILFDEAPWPDPRTYQMALRELGLRPHEVLMVAAHAWDVAGATAQGMRTTFVQRAGAPLYPNATPPDYVAKDLLDLVKQLDKAATSD